jgi:hypothetical protein
MSSREMVVDLSPVSRHLSGRRRHGRRFVQHEVECSNGRRSLQGRVLNLSCSGALVRLTALHLATKTDAEVFAVASQMAFMFSNGMALRFVRTDLLARARVVRVAREQGQGLSLIGLEFGRPLTFSECRKLGIPYEQSQAADA